MPTFAYRAKSGPSQVTEGLVEAENRRAALEKVSALGVFPISVEESRARETDVAASGRVPVRETAFFARQLSDLLESGVPLLKALKVVQRQASRGRLSALLQEVVAAVEGGKTLSAALGRHPEVFPPMHAGLVRAGEVGGLLGQSLGRLADFLEQEEDLKARVRAALAYPLLIAATGGGTVAFLLLFVVPKLAGMFAETGQNLPLATRVLSGASDFLRHRAGWALGGIALIGAVAARALKGRGAVWWGRISAHLPIWGTVERKVGAARFARTLSTLLAGGVPVLEALEATAGVLGPALRAQVLEAAVRVREGSPLSRALQQARDLPPFISHMAAVGEEGNILEKSLEKAALTFEREADRSLKVAVSLLEPLMILGVGGVIGAIVLSLLLPIFQIPTLIR